MRYQIIAITVITSFCCFISLIDSNEEHFRHREHLKPKSEESQSSQESQVNFLLIRSRTEPIESQVTDEKLFGGAYDAQSPTLLLVCGYNDTDAMYSFVSVTATAYLEAYDGSVIAVFWNAGDGNYTAARAAARDVATVLAQFLNRMRAEESLDFESLTVAGFDMGAHIAGIAGRLLSGEISTMIGLDPLNPLSVPGTSDVIDKYSAQFVQVIHTSMSAEGIIQPLGHVDFYPNGGFPPQPGCGSLPNYEWLTCSHNRSWIVYAETFLTPSAFIGRQCSSYEKFQNDLCDNNEKAYMGYGTSKKAIGQFYLYTASSPPFGGETTKSCISTPNAERKQRKGVHSNPDAESITSTEENRVHFHLITRNTEDLPIVSNVSDTQLFQGAYDPSKPTVILIPGYLMGPDNSSFIDTMVKAHLTASDLSIIEVFWDVAFDDYRISSSKMLDVAVVVAQFIDRMVKEESMNLKSVTLIGHSSGAQIGGTAGRLIRGSIAKMMGLDPARPLFMPGATNVIDRNSGEFVQIIHTAGTVLGIFEHLGHVDFYVNTGMPSQPGCENAEYILPINPFSVSCSHLIRPVDLYAESIKNPCAFPARQCSGYEKFQSGGCDNNIVAFMGYKTKITTRGQYYLQTQASSPYGFGAERC